MSYHVQRAPIAYEPVGLYDGPPITITPSGLRALEQARRWRRDRARRALYAASFMVAFGIGTALGLVLH